MQLLVLLCLSLVFGMVKDDIAQRLAHGQHLLDGMLWMRRMVNAVLPMYNIKGVLPELLHQFLCVGKNRSYQRFQSQLREQTIVFARQQVSCGDYELLGRVLLAELRQGPRAYVKNVDRVALNTINVGCNMALNGLVGIKPPVEILGPLQPTTVKPVSPKLYFLFQCD